jgi:hypothetical protein
MIASSTRYIRAAMAGLAMFGLVGHASSQEPSPASMAIARQLIEIKGAARMYDPVLVGIIIKVRDTFLQSNPMLSSELNAVAQELRREFQPRLDALKEHVAKIYASRFTEQELRDVLAFYRSPLGAKLTVVEPEFLDQSMAYADRWAGQVADEVLARMRAEMRKKGHDL